MTAKADRSSSLQGLSEAEALARLREEGPNDLPRPDRRAPLRIVLDVLREPMLALLLVGCALYFALGDWKEALILMIFALLSVVITIVQETRTERVLEALRDLSSPRALVIRDGERRRIAGSEVVRGDLMVLGEGERVAADGGLVECQDLLADESLLTGESAPVRKTIAVQGDVAADRRPGGEDLPFVFSGSLIVRGSAVARVVATGPRSQIGRIGRSLQAVEREPPRLRAESARAVRIFAAAGGAVSLATFALYGYGHGDWLQAALAGIAIGMSMAPEEFPVVLTVFMAMGAWRISKARVLTRRASAIEALGSATVLCTDKTGTLTENRMTIAQLRLPAGLVLDARDAASATTAEFRELAGFGALASALHSVDPMERAFHAFSDGLTTSASADRALVRAFGLRPELLAVTQVWRLADGPNVIVASKGAPEAIADLCKLAPDAQAKMREAADQMAKQGLRVLAIARAECAEAEIPDSVRSFAFTYLGLAGIADPVHASVPAAVAECRAAGIRVVMITGDYPTTAAAIARQAGIDAGTIVTGGELERLTPSALRGRVAQASVFARIMPEQKLAIVEALKANGEVVAMTGDGVNDAPSLKAAHIGVAMGARGADVAREASSLVLLDDDFGSIVQAVRLGRRIYDNLRKAIGFIFSVHVPIAGLALAPLLFGLPSLLGPVHIAFLEMIIDPACSLVFEAEHAEADVMRRPPRSPQAPLFSRSLVVWGAVQGVFAFAVVAAAFAIALMRHMPEGEMRALCFFALVLSIVALIFANRSFGASLRDAIARPGLALSLVLAFVFGALTVSLAWPAARELFRFGPLHGDDLAIVGSLAILMLLALEGLKRFTRATRAA